MNLDDLKAEWRLEMQRTETTVDLGFDALKREVTGVRRGSHYARIWIVFAFLGVSVIEVFVQFVALNDVGWLSKLGAIAWVCFTIWVAVVLGRSAKVTRSDDWTLRSRLEMEIERVQKHRDTWKRVTPWYLLPMMLIVVVQMLGGSHDKTGSYAPGPMGWAILATCAALFAFVNWYCRWGIRRTLDPLLSRLRGLHAELTESETGSADKGGV